MHKMWRWAQLTVAATVVLASLEPEKCHEHSFCEQFDPIKDIWNPCDSDDDPEDTCFVTATEQTATTANIITTSFNTTQNDDHSDITDHIFKGEFCQRSPGIYLIMFNNKTCKYDRNVTGLTMTTNNSHTTVSSNLTMEPSTPDFPKSTTIVQTTTLDVTTPSASIEITTSPPLSLLGLELEPNNMYNIVYENQAYQVKLSLMQPSPVKNLRTINISSSHIQLAWNNTKIIMNHNYKIHFRVKDVTSRDNYYSIPDVTWKIDELTPYTEYEVLLYVDEIYLNASHLSMPKKCTVRTKEAPPHKVQILDIIRNVHNLTLKWDLKKMEYNSKEVKFHVELYNQWKRETTQVFPKYSGHAVTFENLTPHTLYEFKIYAYNCAGEGGTVIDTVRLPIKEPPKNFSSVSASDITATTIKISVIKDKNADINGNITQYSVRVQEIEVKEWTEIKISESLFVHKERWTFTIGDDVTCTITDASCNRPLKPSTSYKLSLRAYTDVNLYKNSQDVLFSTASDNTALVAALAALSALAVCMWAALVWVCGAGDWLRSHVPCWGGVGVAPTPRRPPLTSHPIRLRDFPRYVRTVFNETPEKFGEEFDELKLVGREQPCIAANLPCNRHKNRFTNILPYDHSRFKLQPVDDEEGTDYINANYVPGFSSPRGFIATQGPMASTCGDFWRTVWESGAVAVVMLTRCVEKGAEKCEHYWPYDETPVTYGSVVVTLLEETHYCNWTTSELLICKGDEKRKVTHFQFTSWPDFGVPSPPSTLLQFVRAFRELVRPDQRPILVHCSAGVGRTGTFICLDRLMLQLSSRAEYLDVLGMVHGMRLARTNMVQTQQQYECVHICIASVVDAIEVCKRRSTLVSRRPAPTPLPRTVLPGRAAPAPPPPPRSSQHVHYNLAFEGQSPPTEPLSSISDGAA